MFAKDGVELLEICKSKGISLSEYAILYEMDSKEATREDVIELMRKHYEVMKRSCSEGMEKEVYSVSGLIGGDGYKIKKYLNSGKSVTGNVMIKAMGRAISCAEVNASMGQIVACPTAGSCGILPAVILTAGEKLELSEDEQIIGLFAASALGLIIAQNATLAGAEGGCQAECGSAAAMSAAAVVEMMGGSPEMSLDAAAIVFKNIIGLVCDPIAGLVEVPCAKRNFAGAISALTTADLVMAGVESKIPFDDVLSAVYTVGKNMPSELRETALGGLAITETGIKLKEKVFNNLEK
jgi:L-serine dehydratase, iron-sulfur-dependent, alpha subunit